MASEASVHLRWGTYVDQWLADGHRSRCGDWKDTDSCDVQFMQKYYKNVYQQKN